MKQAGPLMRQSWSRNHGHGDAQEQQQISAKMNKILQLDPVLVYEYTYTYISQYSILEVLKLMKQMNSDTHSCKHSLATLPDWEPPFLSP